MSKRLRESVFSKTEPKDTNVVWYQPTEEVINEKVYNGGWKEVSGSSSGNTDEIIRKEQYYDDGSGHLVPTKHPDLSTQPSILPYKFMGQYVYEILLPIPDIDLSKSEYIVDARKLLEYVKDQYAVTILQAEELLFCYKEKNGPEYSDIPMFTHRNISIYTSKLYGGTIYDLVISPDKTYSETTLNSEVVKAYLRIVYTSMQEEGSYYYNNASDKYAELYGESNFIIYQGVSRKNEPYIYDGSTSVYPYPTSDYNILAFTLAEDYLTKDSVGIILYPDTKAYAEVYILNKLMDTFDISGSGQVFFEKFEYRDAILNKQLRIVVRAQ